MTLAVNAIAFVVLVLFATSNSYLATLGRTVLAYFGVAQLLWVSPIWLATGDEAWVRRGTAVMVMLGALANVAVTLAWPTIVDGLAAGSV